MPAVLFQGSGTVAHDSRMRPATSSTPRPSGPVSAVSHPRLGSSRRDTRGHRDLREAGGVKSSGGAVGRGALPPTTTQAKAPARPGNPRGSTSRGIQRVMAVGRAAWYSRWHSRRPPSRDWPRRAQGGPRGRATGNIEWRGRARECGEPPWITGALPGYVQQCGGVPRRLAGEDHLAGSGGATFTGRVETGSVGGM